MGNPFYIYKFTTMKDLRDKNGNLLPDGLLPKIWTKII